MCVFKLAISKYQENISTTFDFIQYKVTASATALSGAKTSQDNLGNGNSVHSKTLDSLHQEARFGLESGWGS